MTADKKGEEAVEVSPSLSIKIPKEREKLITLGVFPFKLPHKPLNMHQSSRLDHKYAELARYPFVRTFLHEAGVSMRSLQMEGVTYIYCDLSVVRNTYVDGEVSFFLDFTHVPKATSATRNVAVLAKEKADTHKYPSGMTGTIITVAMEERSGVVVIGDALSSLH